MTTKKKKQILTLLSATEVLLFLILVIVVFTFTTGIFTPSQWSTDNALTPKTFSKESLDTLSKENMLQQRILEKDSNNTFLPTVNAATSESPSIDNDQFSENNIMIQANELLIFDEL